MASITYDPKTYAFAVQWIDALCINQTTHCYPDVVHRLAQAVQATLEEFDEENGLSEK